MTERLNPRACFDALYQQACMAMRDCAELRQSMMLGRKLSRSPDTCRREAERGHAVALQEDLQRRCITWADVCDYVSQSCHKDSLSEVDWRSLPLKQTGSRMGAANLVNAITRQAPSGLRSADGFQLSVVSLQQRNRYADRLLAGLGHPEVELAEAKTDIRRRYGWTGAILFIPTWLFTGLIPIKLRADESVNAEYAAFPPLESLLHLRCPSSGPEHWREMLVLWFDNEFGIPEAVRAFIGEMDWQAQSVPVFC